MTVNQFNRAKISAHTVAIINKEMWAIHSVNYTEMTLRLEDKKTCSIPITVPVSMVSEFKTLSDKEYNVFQKNYYAKI